MPFSLLVYISSAISSSKGRTQLLLYVVREQLEIQPSILEKVFATFKMLRLYLAYLSRFLKFDKGPGKMCLDSPFVGGFVFFIS